MESYSQMIGFYQLLSKVPLPFSEGKPGNDGIIAIWICKPYPTCWQTSIQYLTLTNHLIVLVAFLAKLWLSKISKNLIIHGVLTTTSPVKLILSYSYLHRWLSPFPRSLNIPIIHDTISIEEDRIIGNLTIATAGLMFFGAHIGARTNGLRISGKHIWPKDRLNYWSSLGYTWDSGDFLCQKFHVFQINYCNRRMFWFNHFFTASSLERNIPNGKSLGFDHLPVFGVLTSAKGTGWKPNVIVWDWTVWFFTVEALLRFQWQSRLRPQVNYPPLHDF